MSPINKSINNVKTVLRPPKNFMYLVEKNEGLSDSTSIKLPFHISLFYGGRIRLATSMSYFFSKKSDIAALFFSVLISMTDPACE